MVRLSALNLKQDEVESLASSLLTTVSDRRMKAGQSYEREVRAANDSDFPDQREQAFARADHYKSLEDTMKVLHSEMVQIIEDHGIGVEL